MSLILEALKRAEAQRGPDDDKPTPRAGYRRSAAARPRIWRWSWAAAFAALGMILAFILWPRTARLPQALVSAPVPLPPVTALRPVEAPVTAPLSPSAGASFQQEHLPALADPVARRAPETPAPKPVAPATALLPPEKSVIARPAPPTAPPKSEPVPVPKSVQAAPAPASDGEGQAVAAVPRDEQPSREALRKLREMLDKVGVSAHVYADEPSQRFVFVNGRVYREGERVNPEGFRIDEITPDGLVVEKDGARLRVPAAR